jgi:hypothetical protein
MYNVFNTKKTKLIKSFGIKVFIIFFTVFSFSSPIIVLAADGPDEDSSGKDAYYAAQAKLQGQYSDGTSNGASGGTSALSGIAGQTAGAIGTCSIGAILGRFVSSAVGALVNAVIGKLKGFVTGAVDNLITFTAVPTSDSKIQKNTSAQSVKTTGIGHAPVTGLLDWVGNVSLDSIMFCIVNEIMTYITQSTIQWINSGFNGNPVFVQNMGAMLEQIGNREASNFTREIANGAQQAAGQAINGVRNKAYQVAAPFRKGVFNAIAGTQNTSQGLPPLSPRLAQNFNAFTNGNYAAGGGMAGLAEVAYNNPIEANNRAVQEYYIRAARNQQIQQSMITDGTRSFTKCRPGAKPAADGNCDPRDLQVTTPSKAINDTSQSRESMKYMRLSFAQNFDSVVTALVNQLVKIAINKVYESVQN